VQYAERAAQRGSPVLALSNGRDALALCCERRRASRLEDFTAVEKLGEVQPPAPASASSRCRAAYLGFAGVAADGRRLLDKARLFAENYRLRHGEDPAVRDMALFVAGGWCCGVVWCGVVWCGVVWCGVVVCG
jgi:20S proteasome alpha/beta subunit